MKKTLSQDNNFGLFCAGADSNSMQNLIIFDVKGNDIYCRLISSSK